LGSLLEIPKAFAQFAAIDLLEHPSGGDKYLYPLDTMLTGYKLTEPRRMMFPVPVARRLRPKARVPLPMVVAWAWVGGTGPLSLAVTVAAESRTSVIAGFWLILLSANCREYSTNKAPTVNQLD